MLCPILRALFLLITALLVTLNSNGETGGKITGVVKDQSGSVIPGAAVVITNTQTGTKLNASTDQDGVFTFPVLSVGEYQIEVTSDAFQTFRKTGLAIDINSALVLDVTLQVKRQNERNIKLLFSRFGPEKRATQWNRWCISVKAPVF